MMHPSLILFIGVFCEVFVQFGKRSVYWVSSSSPLMHYAFLIVGDLIFIGLFATMLWQLEFRRRHWVVIGIFVGISLYTIVVSGPSAAIFAVRNTYLWILATILFIMSVEHPVGRGAMRSLVGVSRLLAIVLIVFAAIQVQSDYAFEKPWFDFSGTSLNYDGVTNFGQAAKAFSLMSGPTDFAVFGLFALSIGIKTRSWGLSLLGSIIILMSGTRGILIAIPIWVTLAWLSPSHVRRNYLITITSIFSVLFIFAGELISILYAMPNSRFSLATLAPRIQLWLELEPASIVAGGGLAANYSLVSLVDAPAVIDSGLIYLLTEIGGPLTLGLVYVLLTAAQRDLKDSHWGGLQLFVGVLLVASIAQIPFHTRLSNFLICLIIYSQIHYAKSVNLYQLRR